MSKDLDIGEDVGAAETVREGASSEGTARAIKALYDEWIGQLKAEKFDISKLGEAYEGIALNVPLAGQYVEARRKLFEAADKAGVGRGVRVLYHATETGARVGAAIKAQAATLAVSNYGATSSAIANAATLLAGAAMPVGIGIAIVTSVLTFLSSGEMTPEEAMAFAEEFQASRRAAIQLLRTLEDEQNGVQRRIAEQLGFFQVVKRLASFEDPSSFIDDPNLREKYRSMLQKQGIDWAATATEEQLKADVAKRAERIQVAWRKGLQAGGFNLRIREQSMNKVVIWTGPVGAKDVAGATVPGATVKFISCLGDGNPTCGNIAESWTGPTGRKAPGMLREVKLPEGEEPELYLGAFSAGGHIIKRVLLNDEDRARIHAVLLADATYVASWRNEKTREPEPIEGFVKLGVDAAKDGRVFVATASAAPNKTWATGAESLAAIRKEVEARTGKAFDDVTSQASTIFPGLLQPVSIHRMGSVLFADFGAQYKHAEHATVIAPIAWTVVIPLLQKSQGAVESPREGAPPAAPSSASSGGLLARARTFFDRLPSSVKVIGAGLAVATVVAAVSSTDSEKR